MDIVYGTIQAGRVVLEGPVNWPEGTKVEVAPVKSEKRLGLTDDEWPTTPEEIEAWLRWYDSLSPLSSPPRKRPTSPHGGKK